MSTTELRRRARRAVPRKIAPLAALTVLMIFVLSSALAVHDDGTFELDKDGTAGVQVTPVGFIASNITATATTIPVCQTTTGGTFDPNPVNGDTILIQAERMTVQNVNAGGSFGGNCPGTKRNYLVTRAVGGTTATAHSGGAQKIEASVALIQSSTLGGPDWDEVAVDSLADGDCDSPDLVACTFIHDGLTDTIYTIGSTKDDLPLSGWFHTTGSSPDKGEIINAYAAKAISADDHELLYFGMDRWAVDGSTDIGFWFFQDEVVACVATSPRTTGDPCEGVPDGEFAGDHVEGDVLALGTFTQGGATTTIRLFKWVGDAETGEPATDPSDVFVDCRVAGPDDEGCATVNNSTIEAVAPWDYTPKGFTIGHWIPLGGFFEGGIDLTANGLTGCFSSFLAETRSSPTLDAILKDFALDSFESCDTGLVTTPSDADGDALVDNDVPPNGVPDVQLPAGAVGVDVTDSAVLDVSGISDWTGHLKFYLCGPITTGLCDTGGYLVDEFDVSDNDPSTTYTSGTAHLTSAGYYCWRGEFSSTTEGLDPATDANINECFEVKPVTPTLTTTAGANVRVGTAVTDTASLSGTAYQPGDRGSGVFRTIDATMTTPAGGQITFTLRNSACAATGLTVSNSPVTVNGDNPSYGPVSATPGTTGTYHWSASYNGSSPNTLGDDHNTDCSDPAETVEVVDATIDILGDGTNRVNANHTFTVVVKTDTGNGSGLVRTNGATVTVHKVDANLATSIPAGDQNCTTAGSGATAGQCTVGFTSNHTGTTTGTAETSVTVNGVTFSINTTNDAEIAGNESVLKTWVDARIGIVGNDINGIGEPHTFTVTVQKDLGDGAGFVAANGEDVNVTLTNVGGAVYVVNAAASTCDVVGGAQHTNPDTVTGGQCVVVFTSNSAGSVTGNATSALTVSTVQMTVSTTDANSQDPGPVTKEFRAGTLTWIKVDGSAAGTPRLGGATFEVCRIGTLDTSGTPDVIVTHAPTGCVSVADDVDGSGGVTTLDEDGDPGEFLLSGLILGRYTVRETVAPPGYHGDPDTETADDHSLADTSASVALPFVNLRAFRLIVIGCDDITDLLEETTVWVDLNNDTVVDPGETLLSITDVPAHLIAKGVTEADLCGTDAVELPTDIPANGLGGASYGALAPSNYRSTMLIPN